MAVYTTIARQSTLQAVRLISVVGGVSRRTPSTPQTAKTWWNAAYLISVRRSLRLIDIVRSLERRSVKGHMEPSNAFERLVQRYADGRPICNCRRAYYSPVGTGSVNG